MFVTLLLNFASRKFIDSAICICVGKAKILPYGGKVFHFKSKRKVMMLKTTCGLGWKRTVSCYKMYTIILTGRKKIVVFTNTYRALTLV